MSRIDTVEHLPLLEPRMAEVRWKPLANPPSPLQAYVLAARSPHCFFLDSALPVTGMGRFSFIGWRPAFVLSCCGRRVLISTAAGEAFELDANPFSVLRSLLARCSLEPVDLPFPFCGGLVGYLSYDLCHFLEKLPRTAVRDVALPDTYFAFHDRILAFDLLEGKVYAVTCAPRSSAALDEIAAFAAEARQLKIPSNPLPRVSGIRSGFSRASYVEAVQRAREYIFAGDIFEVNISQRFQAKLLGDDLALYLRLRELNPAPFACHIGLEDHAVLSSSPELFLRVRGDHVETRPIKGTRPRGASPEADRRLRNELLHSVKDTAELNMIVDLERNDLGKVCSYGSVSVKEHKAVETYQTVHHLVGTVVGRLHPGRDVVDLIKATFPGGSVTGAPKIRSMEIIDELEPTARNVYTGSIGYISVNGNAELNIAIRTFLRSRDDLYFQAGGAVVADSDPESEYEETLHKVRALFGAMGADVNDLP